MPLDVAAALPATGSGPPSAVGPPEAGLPVGAVTVLFASLLAQQSPVLPATGPPKTFTAVRTAPQDTTAKQDDPDPTGPEDTAPQGPPDPAAIDWTTLGALQVPQPVLTRTAAPLTADAPASGSTALAKEAMDTVSPSAPAVPASAGGASGGLLQFPAGTTPSVAVPPVPVGSPPAVATSPDGKQVRPGTSLPDGQTSVQTGISLGLNAFPSQPQPVPRQTAADGPMSAQAAVVAQPSAPPVPAAQPVTSSVGMQLLTPSVPITPTSSAILAASSAPSAGVSADVTVPAASAATQALSLPVTAVTALSPAAGSPSPARLAPSDVTLADLRPAPVVGMSTPVPAQPPTAAPMAPTLVSARPSPTRAASPPASTALLATPGTYSAAQTTEPQPTLAADPKSSAEAAAQIAIQNGTAPANNTGETSAPQGTATPGAAKTAETKAAVNPGIGTAWATGQSAPPIATAAAKVAAVSGSMKGSTPVAFSDDAPQGADQGDEADSAAPTGWNGVSQSSENIGLALPVPPPTATGGQAPATAAVTGKPISGAERAEVVRQTADAIGALKPQVAAAGRGQMTLQLHPQEWGDLRVTVQLAPAPPVDGAKQTTVVAHVVASSPAVKAALQAQSADLSHALRQTGLQLERLTVTVQAPSADAQSGAAAGGGHSSGSNGQDQWQAAQSQTGAGNGSLGGGGSSSFASFSERQGSGPPQNQSAPRAVLQSTEESGTERAPTISRPTELYAGFDQRV